VAALVLTGCGSGATVPTSQTFFSTVTVSAAPPASPGAPAQDSSQSTVRANYDGPLSGNGTFVVGPLSPENVTPHFPAGKYIVTLSNGATVGTWMRCRSSLCGPEYPSNAIGTYSTSDPRYRGQFDIQPSDAAVWLQNVTLTPAT